MAGFITLQDKIGAFEGGNSDTTPKSHISVNTLFVVIHKLIGKAFL
jgi:hypothetical protein